MAANIHKYGLELAVNIFASTFGLSLEWFINLPNPSSLVASILHVKGKKVQLGSCRFLEIVPVTTNVFGRVDPEQTYWGGVGGGVEGHMPPVYLCLVKGLERTVLGYSC